MQSKVPDVSSGDFIIDFVNIPTLSYTQPIFLRVFEKKYTEHRNWTALYLTLITELYERYPTKINNIKNHSLTSGRKDFSDELGYHTMVAPKKITNEFYVETNLSATDICKKIRKLLDICCVSYTDIEVRYTKKDNIAISSQGFVRTSQTVQQDYDIDIIKSSFSNWMQKKGFAQRTVPNYIAAINQTSQYAKLLYITGLLQRILTVKEMVIRLNLLIRLFALRVDPSDCNQVYV